MTEDKILLDEIDNLKKENERIKSVLSKKEYRWNNIVRYIDDWMLAVFIFIFAAPFVGLGFYALATP